MSVCVDFVADLGQRVVHMHEARSLAPKKGQPQTNAMQMS